MPGRTPTDAVRAFLDPLEVAISCLGQAKITLSPGGKNTPDREHSWMLNGGNGYSRSGWHFEAQMGYRIIRTNEPDRGPWRVTTTAYRYRLAVPEHDLFRMHWHPAGNSPVDYPHLHAALGPERITEQALKAHLRTSRMTLEQAIRWSFEVGMPPACADWEERLDSAEKPHLERRSWH